jgi:hypothetical protein
MLLNWVTSEEAACPVRSYLEHYDQRLEDSKKRIDTHFARPHIHISPLPNPAELLKIHLPPNIEAQTANINIQNIANLWMQLLSIQTQNGNFIRYDNCLKTKRRDDICISQLTPDECTEIYQSLIEEHPPIDQAVAALICSIPYASCNDEDHKIASCTMMPGP